MRLRSLLAQGAIHLYGRVIQAKLHHRQVRRGLLQIIAQPQAGDGQFGGLELVKRIAEVDHKQIALMPQQGKHGGLPGNVVFHLQQRG